MSDIVGRFAPTPSGRMHLGNVFAAMLAWLSVRSQGGKMVLRMEDLDTQRTSAEFASVLREDLLWLGLDWDEETPPQSSRSAVYDKYFEILREKGLFDTPAGIRPEMIIPKPFDPRVVPHVARKVAEAAIRTGVAQLVIDDFDAYEAEVAARIKK